MADRGPGWYDAVFVPGRADGTGPVLLLKIMAKRCEICDKGPVVGRTISHAHNVRPRRFEPNLQTVRAVINGGVRRIRVCTRCIRSGKVIKAA